MTEEPTPEPQERPLGPIPRTPRALNRTVADIIRRATELGTEYEWLYGSGYIQKSVGSSEKTRRSIHGTEHGLEGPEGTDLPMEHLRRRLGSLAEQIENAAGQLRGAARSAKRVQRAIDGVSDEDELVADDPLPVAPPSKAERRRLEEAQRRRKERADNAGQPRDPDRPGRNGTVWAAEEVHG